MFFHNSEIHVWKYLLMLSTDKFMTETNKQSIVHRFTPHGGAFNNQIQLILLISLIEFQE
jgi:hypothetical protein